MKAILKTVATYQMDVYVPAVALSEALPLFSDRPLADQEAVKYGFTTIPGTDSPVLTLSTGWATAFRVDAKVIPPSALKQEIDRLTKKFKEETGYNPGRKEHSQLKGEALANLLPGALAKISVLVLAYSNRTRRLYVTGSQKHVDRAVNALLNVLESAQTTTIHISTPKQGITPRLKAFITDSNEDAFYPFDLGHEAVLVDGAGRKWSVKHDELMNASDTLQDALRQSAQVDSVQLYLEDVPFRLTNKLRTVGVQHKDLGPEALTGLSHEDVLAELTLELDTLDRIWDGLIELLDPKRIQAAVASTLHPADPDPLDGLF